MLFFPEEFFQEEEKCGYTIPKKLKHIWAEDLEMISKLDRICRKYNIKYFAFYGTLLGAVRHRGFIPWDDDVDFCMLREDYDRLIEVVTKEEPTWVIRHSTKGEMRSAIHASIMNSSSMRADKEFLEQHHGCPYIVGFDIFPLDAVPDDKNELEIIKIIYSELYQIYYGYEDLVQSNRLVEYLKEIEELCGCQIDRNANVRLQIWDLLLTFSTIYNGEDFKRVNFYPSWVVNFMKDGDWMIPRTYFDEQVYVKFENIQIPIPKESEEILRRTYGEDYMIPIRMEGHFFFEEQEQLMKDNEEFWEHYPFKE